MRYVIVAFVDSKRRQTWLIWDHHQRGPIPGEYAEKGEARRAARRLNAAS